MIQLSTHEFSDSPFNKTRAAPGQALVSKPPFGPKTRGADRGSNWVLCGIPHPGIIWNPKPWLYPRFAVHYHHSTAISALWKNAQKSLKSPSFPTGMFHHEHMAYSENRAYMGIYRIYPLNPRVHLHFSIDFRSKTGHHNLAPSCSSCSRDEADSSISSKLESSCQCWSSTSSWCLMIRQWPLK